VYACTYILNIRFYVACAFVGFFFPLPCSNCSPSRRCVWVCVCMCALWGGLRRLLCHLANTDTTYQHHHHHQHSFEPLWTCGIPSLWRGHLLGGTPLYLGPAVWVLFDPNTQGVCHFKTMLQAHLGRCWYFLIYMCIGNTGTRQPQWQRTKSDSFIFLNIFLAILRLFKTASQHIFLSCNKQLTKNNL